MRKDEEEQGAKIVSGLLHLFLGGAIGLLFCLIFLFAASFFVLGGLFSEELMYQISIVGCVLGSFAGGRIAISKIPSRRLLTGIFTGAVLFLLLLTLSILCFDAMTLSDGGLGLLLSCVAGGSLAGLLGSKKQQKGQRRSASRRVKV